MSKGVRSQLYFKKCFILPKSKNFQLSRFQWFYLPRSYSMSPAMLNIWNVEPLTVILLLCEADFKMHAICRLCCGDISKTVCMYINSLQRANVDIISRLQLSQNFWRYAILTKLDSTSIIWWPRTWDEVSTFWTVQFVFFAFGLSRVQLFFIIICMNPIFLMYLLIFFLKIFTT